MLLKVVLSLMPVGISGAYIVLLESNISSIVREGFFLLLEGGCVTALPF